MFSKQYEFLKIVVDLLTAMLGIVFLAPLFLVICVLIELDFAGPAIFVQKRVGKNNQLFSLYKFRTMSKETPPYMLKHKSDDGRITKIGRLLRDTGLDEAPQLFNVLKGEMSLVGPRPEMLFVVEGYTEAERQRLKVKPGITGSWQLSGRTQAPIHHNLEYDLTYIKNRSFSLDLSILFKTLILSLTSTLKVLLNIS